MTRRRFETIGDLPDTIAIFPLPGALLFPGGLLPLNIFEPRYLNMIDDAMAGDRLIGMVQALGGGPKHHPEIAAVGTLGEIVSHSETEDGRYLITLRGVSRFEVVQEPPLELPYRTAEVSWDVYEKDLQPDRSLEGEPPELFIAEMDEYLTRNDLSVDRTSVEDAPLDALVNALAMGCPFAPIEKQALLEARDLKARMECLIALFRTDTSGNGAPKWQN